MPLGQHLCANHDIRLTLANCLQYLLNLSGTRHAVAVHAHNPGFRETLDQGSFDTLGALAEVIQTRFGTIRA